MSQRAQLTFLQILLVAALVVILSMFGFGYVNGAHAATDPWGIVPAGGGYQTMTISAQEWVAVTPNNSTDLARIPRAVYSYAGGDVACRDRLGVVITLVLASGETKPYRCTRILSTGTTAADVWAIY